MDEHSIRTPSAADLQFLGAAQSVTGSRYLISTRGRRVLIDCGLFQGYKTLRERNRRPFPVSPGSIDAVVLTHAHLDHSGYLPALVRDGFRGPIFASAPTIELCRIMLLDSAHLLEEEAAHASRHGWSKHPHPLPVYTTEDVTRAMTYFRVLPEERVETPVPGIEVSLVGAGHILGARSARVSVAGTTLHFTGDLGRQDDPLMRPPHALDPVDILVTESTYGDRERPRTDPEDVLGDVVRRTAERGGVVLIPAFAVGRTETILLHLSRLRESGAIPRIPIFLNSPMAISVADVYEAHPDEHRLDAEEISRIYRLATPVRTVEESKELNERGGPMIIIAGSGMLTGGRMLHHLVAFGPDPRNAIVVTGFQAGGTRGATLLGGAGALRIFGRDVPIRAEVVHIDSMSAHADADELLTWMRTVERPPRQVYVTHGEPGAADTLRARITRELGWPARAPEHLETIAL